MTAKPSIDPSQFLHEQLAGASPDLLRTMLATFMNTLMSAEADAVCGAPYGTSSPDRVNVPQRVPPPGLRHPGRHDRRGDPEAAGRELLPGLAADPPQAGRGGPDVGGRYLLPAGGLDPPDGQAGPVAGDQGLSRSQVSRMAADLDDAVEAFRTRPLDQGPYTFVAADALVLKVREGGRIAAVHALIATGVNTDGHREILGLQVTSAEDGAGWLGFFRDLTARGLTGVRLVTSDAHAGLDRRHRRHPARRGLAAVPHPLRREPDVGNPEELLAVGPNPAALGLRPARRRSRRTTSSTRS